MLLMPAPKDSGKAIKTTSCNVSLFAITIKDKERTSNRNKMLNQNDTKLTEHEKLKPFFLTFL